MITYKFPSQRILLIKMEAILESPIIPIPIA